MFRRDLAALAAAVLLAPVAAPARDLYVDPAGSNSTGDGSMGNPYRTISHALTLALSNDVLVLRAGTYAEDVKVTVSAVTIRSMAGEWAVIALPETDPLLPQPMWIATTWVALRRLELAGGYNYGLKIDAGRATVEDCKIHGSGTHGVRISGAADVTLRRTEVWDTGRRDPAAADGINSLGTDRLHLDAVHVHDVPGNGVDTHGGSRDCLFERLTIERVGSRGVRLGYYTADADMDPVANPGWYETIDCEVRNSLVTGAASAGIALFAAARPRLVNNTLLRVAETSDGGILFAPVTHATLPRASEQARIANHVVTLAATSARRLVDVRAGGVGLPASWENNRYQHEGATALFRDSSIDYDLAGWKAHVSGDALSSEGDPLLRADGRLRPGSPCIDAGTATGAPGDDRDGDPRPLDGDNDTIAIVDIGADERPWAPPADLLRGDFSALVPRTPDPATVFPLTRVVLSGFLTGDVDPTPGILDDPGIPLAAYEVSVAGTGKLELVKERAAGTVRAFLQ